MLKNLFPGFRRAKKSYRSVTPSHFAPIRFLWADAPGAFQDQSSAEVARVNEASQKYYESAEMTAFWMGKPFSDPMSAPWLLWRFGALVAGLRLIPRIRILDFGCGSGWTSIMLAQMGAEVVGMDIAPRAIDLANLSADKMLDPAQRARCSFQTFSGDKFPFENSSFDIVMIFDAFHHLPNPSHVLHEIVRVLGTHGRFGFAEPGVGHSEHEHSASEMEHGILEQDLDLEQVFRTGIAAGFRDLEILIPGIHPDVTTLPMKRTRWFLRGASWLLPANFFRHGIVTSPTGIFTKSPYAASSLNPISHCAKISPTTERLRMKTGEPFSLSAHVTNSSNTVWLKGAERGVGYVTMGASLFSAGGAMIQKDFGRAHLPKDALPGDRFEVSVKLQTPTPAGNFMVRLDMVNEGVCWFVDRGSPVAEIPLEVTS